MASAENEDGDEYQRLNSSQQVLAKNSSIAGGGFYSIEYYLPGGAGANHHAPGDFTSRSLPRKTT